PGLTVLERPADEPGVRGPVCAAADLPAARARDPRREADPLHQRIPHHVLLPGDRLSGGDRPDLHLAVRLARRRQRGARVRVANRPAAPLPLPTLGPPPHPDPADGLAGTG